MNAEKMTARQEIYRALEKSAQAELTRAWALIDALDGGVRYVHEYLGTDYVHRALVATVDECGVVTVEDMRTGQTLARSRAVVGEDIDPRFIEEEGKRFSCGTPPREVVWLAECALERAFNLIQAKTGGTIYKHKYCGCVATVSIRGVLTVASETTGQIFARSLPACRDVVDPRFLREEVARIFDSRGDEYAG